MNNAQKRIALAFTAGVCVGGGLGYLIASRSIGRQAEKDLEAVQAMFRRVREEDSEQSDTLVQGDADLEAEHEAEGGYQTPAQSFAAEEVVRLGYATQEQVQRSNQHDPHYLPPEEQDADDGFPSEYAPYREPEVADVRRISHNPMHEPDPDDVTTWERNPHLPYVITESEFRIDMPEYEKDSLTYYMGDDVLAEENGNYIPDKHGTAGNENLRSFFGFGSGDENLLYIRNERVMTDFEITLNEGRYSKEVLDVDDDDELPRRPIRKMRRGD